MGAILVIKEVKPHNYGRYLCRIEIGNAAHRLEMSAWIFGTPIHAQENDLGPALALGLAIGAVILIFLLIFVVRYVAIFIADRQRREKKLCQMTANETMRIREVI